MSRDYQTQTPIAARVVEFIQESDAIFTLRLQLEDAAERARYQFMPGQFNMLYLFGVGEVPISIVSDPLDDDIIDHTVRVVGRVTRGLAQLKKGDRLGLRGPFGHGWPLALARDKDLLIVTGGLGCAPVVSAINYALKRPEHYRKLSIVQGVKHANDLIWQHRYDDWREREGVEVLLAADEAGPAWPFHVGRITELLDHVTTAYDNCVVMICGPEGLMQRAAELLLEKGVPPYSIYLSMERNMQCAVGHCGHCQLGADFICKDGPVFVYPDIRERLLQEGV
ncbi:FAD/NAD(P)-binding protein [Neptuniibacter pectenicola]|jgi:NAD(P)H-flavin reductase|uniref:FAD/NAD(P)-binding protein n=1 Tax=Neptuniibacter pectenicola TaxID=1806669 RepID=A0ABU9TQ52_9GAMM|nr:FAD/NAD(P)-binding protein [Neptuniibacter pectenicola]